MGRASGWAWKTSNVGRLLPNYRDREPYIGIANYKSRRFNSCQLRPVQDLEEEQACSLLHSRPRQDRRSSGDLRLALPPPGPAESRHSEELSQQDGAFGQEGNQTHSLTPLEMPVPVLGGSTPKDEGPEQGEAAEQGEVGGRNLREATLEEADPGATSSAPRETPPRQLRRGPVATTAKSENR